ncbi:MAG: glycosyltransferase, partial [Bacteroidales bacterium]|nr:glycosyltransferase [Bacteroidales bacterium]
MKISLITVTFNSAETLRDTMQSVLNQTFKDIDYIIVDGKSKDGTLDIVKEFEPKFEGRLRWVSEPDKGIYDAMNKGVKMAQGDVVGILNSDDFFASDKVLETVNAAFTENP